MYTKINIQGVLFHVITYCNDLISSKEMLYWKDLLLNWDNKHVY